MSSWLKRQQPIQLYQGSNTPYIILKDGVYLCCNNCFGISDDNSEHNICFYADSSSLKRINTYFYKFTSFPNTLPFIDVISLDDVITEGRTVKNLSENQGDPKSVAIMKSEYINNTMNSNLSNIGETLDEFDTSFILVGDNIDPQVRLFEDVSTIVHHAEWEQTVITISDTMCDNSSRKYCWTNNVPELSISCYGIKNSDELIKINNSFHDIGVNDVSVNWAG